MREFLIQPGHLLRIFFVAKRKKRAKSRSKAQPKRTKAPFVGDQILALYQVIGSCCSVTSVTILASIALGYAFTTDLKKQIFAKVPDKEIQSYINGLGPTIGIVLYVLAAVLLIFSILYIRATWLGKKWAIWLHLLLNLPSAALTIVFIQADSRLGSILPIVISIYCLLRVAGSVGPKM